MLPRFLLNLMTLNWNFWPMYRSRFRTGRRSTWEPGRNALTPMSTVSPPLTRLEMMPSTSSPRSVASSISSQIFSFSALSLESWTRPCSSSSSSTYTETLWPSLASTLPSTPMNSSRGICPSDL